MPQQVDAIRKYTFQPENKSITATIHPFQGHNITAHSFQDHIAIITPSLDNTTVNSIKDLKSMFPDSFNKIGNMPGEYTLHLIPIPHSATGKVQSPYTGLERDWNTMRQMSARYHAPTDESYILVEFSYISSQG